MSKDNQLPQQPYLLRTILEDDNPKTVKQNISQIRPFACSAPPVLFGIAYKINEEEIADWDFEEPEDDKKNNFKSNVTKKEQKPKHQFSPQITPHKYNYTHEIPQFNGFSLYQINQPQYFQPIIIQNQNTTNTISQVSQWSRDQHGSRHVQGILQNGSDQQKDQIFNSVFHQAKELIQDRFGNYVFQKLFQKGLSKHKQLLFKAIQGNIVQLSENAYGCRVIQKAIESIANDSCKQDQLIKEIQPSALRLIQNQNGNHVVQKCFQIIQTPKMNKIITIIIAELSNLAFHAYGCRVIQKYLENAEKGQNCKIVLNKLLDVGFELSQCQYGNYVMQHIVSSCPDQQPRVSQIFFQNFVKLSCNKYASNVIEKQIKYSQQSFKDRVVIWLTTSGVKDLVYLAKDQFGNYVIQSLYDSVRKELKLALKGKLNQCSQQITKSQYGRHVLMQLNKNR